MPDRKKPLELVLRYGDVEAVHTFPNIGDFEEAMKDLTAYCGIPVDAELVSLVNAEIFMLLIGKETMNKLLDLEPLRDLGSPMIRKLVAEVVEKVKAAGDRDLAPGFRFSPWSDD